MSACDACLRRAGLVAALAGHLEVAWLQRRSALRDVLALDDDALAAALNAGEAAAVLEGRRELRPDRILASCAALGIEAICRHDGDYPSRLRELADAPAVLFVLGGRERWRARLRSDAVAMVGTRRASAEAVEVARGLARGVAAAGLPVVSGMAMGIDAAAHRGALEAGGPTVAVLACGPDVAYPRLEAALHRRLAEREIVISELPPGVTPRRWAFPARNRIIAGLSALTVVVEAAARSGSLITAEFAIALGRDVAAVPGRAGSPETRGSNELLREGAAVVLDAEDVLDLVLGTDRPAAPGADPAAELPQRLRDVLLDVRRGHGTVPALVRAGHDLDDAMVALAELELLGLVRRALGGAVVAVSG